MESGKSSRREFLAVSTSLAATSAVGWGAAPPAQVTWDAGQVAHLIPTASHDRLLIKASFKQPLATAPRLMVNGKATVAIPTDPQGRFWIFDATGLQPATSHELRIWDAGGQALCDAWPLKTHPAPTAVPKRLRILAFGCAGGYDGPALDGKAFFLDMKVRRRLLARGMGFKPDVVIANGDHIYWDLQTSLNKPHAKFVREELWTKFGPELDLTVPMLHPKNLATFTGICDYQIGGLYGTTLRSTPAYFVSDDHDMFENDEFDSSVATMPPDSYGVSGAEQTQRLYYPEFLPDANRPVWLPGGDKAGSPWGTNLSFGTFRYGKLLESVFYDCRRYADYKGDRARILPQWVEEWLIARTRAEDTTHFLHAPSLPFGFSSGKLGSWYPDVLDEETGRLVSSKEKPGWQRGWFAQHQRLIEAMAAQKKRASVIVQGDFHVSAVSRITRSGELSLPRPVEVLSAGTLGAGDLGFPSSYRNTETMPSHLIGMTQALKPAEKNGFSIIDVTPERLTFTVFTWRPPQPVEAIDTMKPALVHKVSRKA